MRQVSRVIATACAVVLLGFATARAQGAPTPGSAQASAAPVAGSSRPFERLFTPQQFDARLRSQVLIAREKLKDVESGSTRRFICGMPVLQADPAVDPRAIVRPPDTRTRFEIRTFVPTCR